MHYVFHILKCYNIYEPIIKDTYITITASFATPIFHSKIYKKLCSELFHIQKGFNERVLLLLLRALELNNAVNISEYTRWFKRNYKFAISYLY